MKNLFRVRKLAVYAAFLAATACVHAQISQIPLLTRSSTVEPNIVLLFDDSGSMDNTYLYQESSSSLWGQSVTIGGNGVDPPSGAETYAKCSPQVNRLYYDPSVRYNPFTKSDGTYQSNGSTSTARNNAPCKDNSDNPRVYMYKGGGLAYNVSSSYNRIEIQSGDTYTKSANRTDCAGSSCTYSEEIQNYANWYKYYRSRLEMAKTSLSAAFIDLPSTFRLGWGVINTLEGGNLTAGVSTYNTSTRDRFYDWLDVISTNGGTPNRKAVDTVGKYFSRDDSDGPWGTTPRYQSTGSSNVASPTSTEAKTAHAACRRSYAMLVTDGYYNDSFTISNVDNTTGNTLTSSRGATYKYVPAAPYKDSWDNTLSDIVMKYWGNDLRTDIANNVSPVPGLDPAFWQHMNFYAISLGLEGTIPQTQANLNQLIAGTKSWPQPGADKLEAIDDMWHATINGRGDFLNAKDSTELTSSLLSLVGQILKASSSQAGVAVSTVNLISGTKKFVPIYTTGDWTGNLIATNLNEVTGNEISNAWQVETKTSSGLEGTNTIGYYANRNIYVGNVGSPSAGTDKAVAFNLTAMNTQGLTASMTGVVTDSLIKYLAGDRSGEGSAGTFRTRAFLLGDIVNSTPVFIKPAYDYGYAKLGAGAGGSSYSTYLTQKGTRAEGAIFVGANDGMLHAFGESDGREVFAYVPRAVLPNIAQLADNTYQHRFFVDGPISQGDYFDGSNWQNVVVGTTGAGAKAVFAIKATNPVSLNASNVLWEINDGVSGFDELGHVLSEVRLGIMRDGSWAAIFGNGYFSKSKKASLFIVNLKTGALIKKIDAGSAGNNGLGGVRLVLNSNNEVIGAYAGDLQGNLWKFDLNSASTTNWKLGYNDQAMFIAKDKTNAVQPITAAPFVTVHPTSGYVVTFGTGKFFELSDTTVTAVQSAYGLRDTATFGTPTLGNPIASTSTLVLQTISQSITVSRVVTSFDDSTSSQVITYFSVSNNTINWTTKSGWYFHLPNSGQRTIYPVDELAFGRLVRVDTIQPGAVSSDPCAAGSAGVGYNYIIDALTGGSPQVNLIDTNGDGNVDSSDAFGASGYSASADGRDIAIERSSTSSATAKDIVVLDSGGSSTIVKADICKIDPAQCASTTLKTIQKRAWRQLFLR